MGCPNDSVLKRRSLKLPNLRTRGLCLVLVRPVIIEMEILVPNLMRPGTNTSHQHPQKR